MSKDSSENGSRCLPSSRIVMHHMQDSLNSDLMCILRVQSKYFPGARELESPDYKISLALSRGSSVVNTGVLSKGKLTG